jgi:phage host-nuclease inhibitor protein Gam
MENSIAAETLAFFQNFSARDSRIDRLRGEKDGERNYPPRDATTFSTYEQTRIAEARSAVTQYTRRMRQTVDRLDNQIREKTLLRDEDYGSQKRSLNDELASKLKQLGALSGLESQEHAEHNRELEDRVQTQRKIIHRLGRNPKLTMHEPFFNHRLLTFISQPYVAALILLAMLETPINSFAVELAIGFLPPISLIVAFLIGVVFVLIAHFIGIHMRRLTSGTLLAGFWRGLVMVLALMLGIFMIYVLFAMRGEVTELITPGGLTNLDILGDAPAPPAPEVGISILSVLEEPLRKYFNISGAGILSDETKFAQLGLLMLNTLVLIIGTVLSFVRHDPDSDMEAATMALLAARRQVNRFLRAFRVAQAREIESFGRRITELQREADQLNNEVEHLEGEREQFFAQMDNDVGQIFSVLAEQITAYQDGNRNTRNADDPAYFGKAGMRQLGTEILAE